MPIGRYFGGHGKQVMSSMRKSYGAKKAKSVFYATAHKKGNGPVSHKGSLRKAVKKRKGHVPSAISPFYKKKHKTYDV